MTEKDFDILATEVRGNKELFTDRIDAFIKLMDERFSHEKEALRLQAIEYSRRLDGLNHEAQQLKDMQTTYLPREVYDTQHQSLCHDVSNLKETRASLEEMKTIRSDIAGLKESRAMLEGKASQQDLNRTSTVATVGAVVGILGIIVAIVAIIVVLV
ncbi:MAG: hypothetical protein WC343_14475 [Bacilli bacterium]|jgi:hypothetical protein